MPGRDSNDSELLSAREQKRALGEIAKILSSRYPNPERKGCPGSQALKNAAFHRPMANLNEVLDHTLQCSPCFVESQKYVRQYPRKKLLFRTVLPIAASILMVAATYFYWVGREETKAPTHFQQMSPEIVSHPPNSARSPVQPTPLVHAVTITIQSPTRGPITPTAPRVYTLPRGIVDLTLEMPMGYGEGTFKVQISGKKSKLEYRVNAHSQGGLIRIQSRVDFSAFEPGPYQLTVGKLEESAKYAVPLQIE